MPAKAGIQSLKRLFTILSILDIQQIPKIDAVIISHDHYDHLNKFSVQRLIEKSNKFIVPLAVGARLIDWGVPP